MCLKREEEKKIERKKPEFPAETDPDPLDEEAEKYVQKILKNRDLDGTIIENIGEEKYFGNIEYKRTISDKGGERIKHLTTQLNFRLIEGKGQAIYRIGVEDDGTPLGINDHNLIGSISNFSTFYI